MQNIAERRMETARRMMDPELNETSFISTSLLIVGFRVIQVDCYSHDTVEDCDVQLNISPACSHLPGMAACAEIEPSRRLSNSHLFIISSCRALISCTHCRRLKKVGAPLMSCTVV